MGLDRATAGFNWPLFGRLACVCVTLIQCIGLAPALLWAAAPDRVGQTSQLSLAVNYAHEWVSGNTDPGAVVSVSLTDNTGGLKDQATATADGTGYFLTQWADWTSGAPDIQPGDYVYASVPGASADVSPVGELRMRPYADTETVTGTLHAGWFAGPLDVLCAVWETPGPPAISTAAATDGGAFACNFSEFGWDLQPSQTVAAEYREPDGDRVINVADWPWMRVNYAHDKVGANYPAGYAFTITVTESDGVTVKATGAAESIAGGGWDGDGFEAVEWSPGAADIVPGDKVIFASNDGYQNTVSVGQINGILDIETDLVYGTVLAPQFTDPLEVQCHPWGGWAAGLSDLEILFQYDIAPDGGIPGWGCAWGDQEDPPRWDIQPGQDVAVMYLEPDDFDYIIDVYREPLPHLRVSQWAHGDAAAGGNFALRIRYRNDADAAENVSLTVNLGGLSYLADTSGFSHTGSGAGPLVWNLGTLEAGALAEFDLFVAVTAPVGGALSSTVEIATSGFDEGDPSEKVAVWQGEAEGSDTQLAVRKRAWTEDPAPDQDIVYEVEICNQGATGSSTLTLADEPNAPLSLVMWWAGEAGWSEVSFSPNALVVELPSLPGFACTEVFVRAHVPAETGPGALLVNSATIAASNDLTPQDNTVVHEAEVHAPHLNLQITKRAGPGSPVPGGELRYLIEFANTGNVAYAAVFPVVDTFPPGTSYLGAWLHDGVTTIPFPPAELGPGHAVWTIPGLDNGYRGQIELALDVAPEAMPGTVMSNTVVLEGAPGEDSYADNAFEWQDVLLNAGPNLHVCKSSRPVAGGVAYDIHFANPGDTTVEGVVVADTLPAFTSPDGTWWRDEKFDWDRLDSFTQLDGQLTWTFSELRPGEAGTIHFHLDLEQPEVSHRLVNTVEITLPPGDVDPSDNVASDVIFAGGDVIFANGFESDD